MLSLVPWSRSFDDQVLLAAINTDPNQTRTAWVDLAVDDNPVGKTLHCLYSTDPSQIGAKLVVQSAGDRRVVNLSVPAAGFVVFE
jgi:hypothetical protein